MALISEIGPSDSSRHTVHAATEATYKIFVVDGQTYLQIDTVGTPGRKNPGKMSQTIQFNPDAITQLRKILARID